MAISLPVDCGMNKGDGGRSRKASVWTSTSASSMRSLNLLKRLFDENVEMDYLPEFFKIKFGLYIDIFSIMYRFGCSCTDLFTCFTSSDRTSFSFLLTLYFNWIRLSMLSKQFLVLLNSKAKNNSRQEVYEEHKCFHE